MKKMMTCVMSVLFLLSVSSVSFAEVDVHSFPNENPIFSLSLPSACMVVSSMFPNSWREWTKDDVQGSGAVPFQASPDFSQEGRLLITLFAFVPDAVADLDAAEQNARELIGERIENFTPKSEKWEKTTINEIPFIFMEATGEEKARKGVQVSISAGFFNPEGTHVFLLLVTGSYKILEKYAEELLNLISSIKPGT